MLKHFIKRSYVKHGKFGKIISFYPFVAHRVPKFWKLKIFLKNFHFRVQIADVIKINDLTNVFFSISYFQILLTIIVKSFIELGEIHRKILSVVDSITLFLTYSVPTQLDPNRVKQKSTWGPPIDHLNLEVLLSQVVNEIP